jgi:hypothetical protein
MTWTDAITGRRIALVVMAYGGAMALGVVEAPWKVDGLAAGVTAAVVAGLVGYLAAGKFDDLLPDDEGIYVIEYDDRQNGGGRLYEVTEDKWADVDGVGELHQWEDSPKRVYECVRFDPEANEIEGNWRSSKPASALNAETTVEDVLMSIRELRDHFERMGRESKVLKRSLRAIIRDLEEQRARQQNRILDENTVPSMGDEATIDELIESHIPEDIRPQSVDPESGTEQETAGETVSFDVLDDSSGLDPVATDGGDTHE